MTQPRSFTVYGRRNGSQIHISWTGGELSGDQPTIDLVSIEAELATLGVDDHQSWAQVSYSEQPLAADPLADPSSTWWLIKNVLDKVNQVEGDAPPEAADQVR